MADEQQEKKPWVDPTCKGCGEVIKFLIVKSKDGTLKSHPINVDSVFVLVSTGEKNEKGQFIYGARKGYISHFATCPKADTFRNKEKPPQEQQPPAEDDKPPF